MNKHRKKYIESHREILRNRIEHAIDDYMECTKDRIAKIEPYYTKIEPDYLRSKCAETDGEVYFMGVEIEYMLNTACSEKQASEREGDE